MRRATPPAMRNAIGAAPRASSIDNPRTAKMPPPTIPPIPIATVLASPSVRLGPGECTGERVPFGAAFGTSTRRIICPSTEPNAGRSALTGLVAAGSARHIGHRGAVQSTADPADSDFLQTNPRLTEQNF